MLKFVRVKTLKFVLMLIAVLGVIACGDDTEEVVGNWKGTYEGAIGVVTFYNDGRCTLNAERGTFHGSYLVHGNLLEVNYKTKKIIGTFSINGNLMTLGATYDGEQHTMILERGL